MFRYLLLLAEVSLAEMACRRSVSTTVTFGTRRFHPSFSHILHDNNEDAKSHAPNSSSPPPVIKSTLPSGSYNSTLGFCFGSRCRERTGSSLAWKMGLGSFHCRYMSTVIDDGSDKINDVGYFAEVITDKTVEVVTSQAPAVSEVAAAAADSFFPVAALQYLIDGVHSFTGCNWWASIALTTILIRGATIPLLINQLRATTQLSLMRPHLEELKQQMQDMAMDPNVLQEGQKRMKALFKEYGVNPLSQLQPLFIQGPIFISFFLAVRNMAEKVPSFQSGGALWFTDLTTPDSLLILPVLTSLTFLITVECNMQEGLEGNPIAQTMKNYSRILAAISIPVMMSFPKALFCYWLTSNLFSLTYGLVLTVPVRCACPSENQTADGITSLLTYIVAKNDTIASIGGMFGVNTQSITVANMLSQDIIIDLKTPVLVPLKSKRCPTSDGSLADGIYLEYVDCIRGGKKFPVKLVTLLGIGIGLAFICMFLSGYKLYQCLKRRRIKTQQEKFFKQNGGFLLQEKISSFGSSSKAKLFTAEELERATDNYNQSRFLGQGGYGTVYKGMLLDGTIVAVKRSRAIDKHQIEQFINEVVILTQINHRNIVKLLGCCLETEVPVLVYEYIPNGTLSHHIQQKHIETPSLSWEHRFRIACEVAGAVSYMHSAASIPIFHRDIKSSNILLDHNYSAKVSDFGTSKSVPLDKTHLTTEVQGTFGYMDPEYFQSSKFTDKSDTYSFGVTLVEILTGKTPFSFAKDDGENLVASFISLTRENQLVQILDPQVVREAEMEHVGAIAELATRCLRLNGKKRPSMKEVSTELEGLRNTQRCLEKFQEPQSFKDETTFMHSTSETMKDHTEESIDFSMEIESASF